MANAYFQTAYSESKLTLDNHSRGSRTDDTNARIALLAEALLATIGQNSHPNPSRLATAGTEKSNIGGSHWHLARETTTLRTLGMAAPHVLKNAINTFNQDFVTGLNNS
jgi:hypothetical protein